MKPGKLKEMRRLQTLTNAVRMAEQARLSAAVAETVRIQERLDDLSEARASRNAELRGGIDLAARAGVDPLWQHWADGRREGLNRDLAIARARQERIRADMAKAYGRNEVAERMVRLLRAAQFEANAKRKGQTS